MQKGYSVNKLEKQIGCIKYTLFCFNVVAWLCGVALFGLTVWIRAEPGFDDWITKMEIKSFFIGIYILLGASIIVMVIAFLGCLSALTENLTALFAYLCTQGLGFILASVGSAILLDHSTMNSSIQYNIRDTMRRLIMSSEYPHSNAVLKMIQENIGCCGADGPADYIHLKQPLPAECRDTITGNAFFHGCVDELTWFLEDKSAWIAGLAMTIALINVICGVMSLSLMQAIKKEEERS